MKMVKKLVFLVPLFAITAVAFLAFSSFAQVPQYISPIGLGEGMVYEEYSTVPKTADSYAVSLGKSFFRVVAPTSVPYIASMDRATQSIFIPIGFRWIIHLKAGGEDGLYYNSYSADALRVLVGIKVLNVDTGQYVPANILKKYVKALYWPITPPSHSSVTTVKAGIGIGVGRGPEIIPSFNAWLEVEEQFWGNANMRIYETVNNTIYKWTWDGFVFLGHWFRPHIGSIQYNITPTGSGDMWGVGYIAIVMKPLPFMLRGEPARIFIYVLPEFEWNCLVVSYFFPPAIGNYTVRAGTAFILGDNYAFHGTIVVHGNNGYNYTNSYGGVDGYIWFVPKKSSS